MESLSFFERMRGLAYDKYEWEQLIELLATINSNEEFEIASDYLASVVKLYSAGRFILDEGYDFFRWQLQIEQMLFRSKNFDKINHRVVRAEGVNLQLLIKKAKAKEFDISRYNKVIAELGVEIAEINLSARIDDVLAMFGLFTAQKFSENERRRVRRHLVEAVNVARECGVDLVSYEIRLQQARNAIGFGSIVP